MLSISAIKGEKRGRTGYWSGGKCEKSAKRWFSAAFQSGGSAIASQPLCGTQQSSLLSLYDTYVHVSILDSWPSVNLVPIAKRVSDFHLPLPTTVNQKNTDWSKCYWSPEIRSDDWIERLAYFHRH